MLKNYLYAKHTASVFATIVLDNFKHHYYIIYIPIIVLLGMIKISGC